MLITLAAPEPSAVANDDYIRIHDQELQAGYWDEVTGEFITPPKKESNKLQATQAVCAVLKIARGKK